MFKDNKDRSSAVKINNGHTTDSDGNMKVIHNFEGLGLLMKIKNSYPDMGKSKPSSDLIKLAIEDK